tara:strand:+ start:114 stop:296 length:183 start_codon:yes stop_codon:yes gene_type:complete
MGEVITTLLRYLKQDSTWRGIIALATSAGVVVSPELASGIIAAGVGLIGLINLLRDGDKV